MDSFVIGLVAGLAAVAVVAVIVKWRRRGIPETPAERAEYLSTRRTRMLPALAVIFLSQQVSYFSAVNAPGPHAAQNVKISAWLVLSIVLLAALTTKGFWFESKEVRDLLDDENTRANRLMAMRAGFLTSMAAAILVYIGTMFDTISGREAVHFIMSVGIAVALITWGFLEKRAYRDA